MEFLDKKTIKLGRELSELDKFVISFVDILKNHFNYVVVSGYVSILFGRSRATEDVDLLVKNPEKEKFVEFFDELLENDFECLNTSNSEEAFQMLEEHAIRFAKKDTAIPNIEFKAAKTEIDKEALRDHLNVKMNSAELKISNLELQIAFKRFVLASDKDEEDAKHIEIIFSEHLDKEKLKRYADLLKP